MSAVCPGCGVLLEQPRHWRGQTAICPDCFAGKTAAELDKAAAR